MEWRSKGVITSLAAQQQISAGTTESGTEAVRSTHLEEELKDAKVFKLYFFFFFAKGK